MGSDSIDILQFKGTDPSNLPDLNQAVDKVTRFADSPILISHTGYIKLQLILSIPV